MELPKGGGHAIRSRPCMFREGRLLSTWLHFGFHFGIILGAQFATILFVGRPGVFWVGIASRFRFQRYSVDFQGRPSILVTRTSGGVSTVWVA